MNNPVKLGTCAWSFDDWRGAFYPPELPPNQWLGWYARFLSAVEIDSTFYAAPSAQTIANWLNATPDDFRFTCKLPREITHSRKLRNSGDLVHAFLASIKPLRPKLGPVLIQLPPYFEPSQDEDALKDFIFELPHEISFAVEFRHPDWHQPRIVKLLENMGICWVWNDTSSLRNQNRAPFTFLPQTADCLYIRLLGDLKTKSHHGVSPHHYNRLMWPRDFALESWAVKIKKNLGKARCIYVFANNHYEGFSPQTCQRLARHLGKEIPPLPQMNSSRRKQAAENMQQLTLF